MWVQGFVSLTHLHALWALLCRAVHQEVPLVGPADVDAVGGGVLRHRQHLVAVVRQLLHHLEAGELLVTKDHLGEQC